MDHSYRGSLEGGRDGLEPDVRFDEVKQEADDQIASSGVATDADLVARDPERTSEVTISCLNLDQLRWVDGFGGQI